MLEQSASQSTQRLRIFKIQSESSGFSFLRMLPKVVEFFTKHFEVWWSVSVDISRVHEVIKAHDVRMSQSKPWKLWLRPCWT